MCFVCTLTIEPHRSRRLIFGYHLCFIKCGNQRTEMVSNLPNVPRPESGRGGTDRLPLEPALNHACSSASLLAGARTSFCLVRRFSRSCTLLFSFSMASLAFCFSWAMLLSEIWKSRTSGLRACARGREGNGFVIVETSESGFGSKSCRIRTPTGERREPGSHVLVSHAHQRESSSSFRNLGPAFGK